MKNAIDDKIEELIKLLVPAYVGKMRESANLKFSTYITGLTGRRVVKIEIYADVDDPERSIKSTDNVP